MQKDKTCLFHYYSTPFLWIVILTIPLDFRCIAHTTLDTINRTTDTRGKTGRGFIYKQIMSADQI